MKLKTITTSFISVLLLLISIEAFAKFVPEQEAETIARNFFAERYYNYLLGNNKALTSDIRPGQIQFEEAKLIEDHNQTLIYVFNRPYNGGYILVSADDKAFPILNYAFKGHYNPKDENIPEGLRYFIEGYKQQIAYAVEKDISSNQQTSEAWKKYSTSSLKSQVKGQAPLTDSIAWNQDCYFNALCPTDPNAGAGLCNHVPVGCVATAMGIVMKYHSYPSSGSGTETYNSNYGQLSVDFGNTIYDWDNMPNQLNNHNAEVAKISYHAGVAVNMNYSANGSGALFGHSYYTPTAETALKNHFKYPNADWEDKSSYSFAAWENRLRDNLDSLNPVLYAGGVHAFVCDGYQGSSNNHFHFNWGWGGMYNSYCYLNSIVPGGTGTGGGTGNYTNNQQAIFDVEPPKTSPVADFCANTTTVSPGGSVFFTDLTDYVPTSWHWEFGDGNTSSTQFPVHTYDSVGTYNVKLFVDNSYGTDSVLKSGHINVVQNSNITANIYLPTDTAYVSDQITFKDVSSGNPTASTWDFGDNNYANNTQPKHTYSVAANYTVHLTSANSTGSDTTSESIVILPAPVPSAEFEADTVSVAAGTDTKFYDLTTNQPSQWEWDFGDGYTSSYQNPTHQYQDTGHYTIKLVVTNSYGADSIIKQNYIYVYQSPPIADFTVSNTSTVDGQSIQFIDQSKGIVDNYYWEFGDGNSSSKRYPTHAYSNPGVYTVSLMVTNSAGSDTLTKADLISVSGTGVKTHQELEFKAYPNPASDLLKVELNNPEAIRQLKIIDITGKTVLQKVNPDQITVFDLDQFSQGLYLLEVVGEQHIVRQKIMVR
ncbi:MAG: C10 family peptidase [Bacteroidales bacterium]|nr:C10 family peptidase [Bacteroidales bacterium]